MTLLEPYPAGPAPTGCAVKPWHPKTEHPEFFSFHVDGKCDANDEDALSRLFGNFVIRPEKDIVIATPYNKWWSPKLPIFFVDDDTQLYTIGTLQLYGI